MLNINLILGIIIILNFLYLKVESQNNNTGTILPTNGCPIPPKVCPCPLIRFFLYTSQVDGYELNVTDPNWPQKAPFQKNAPIVVSIHGLLGNKSAPPNRQLIPAYKKKGNTNLIVVDYGPLAPAVLCAPQSTQNVPLVANCTARVVDEIIKQRPEFDLSCFHFLGFSLGSQVAAQMRFYKQTPGQYVRITGMDPAPIGIESNTVGPYYQLTKDDAGFVDILHTNAGGIGRPEPTGHSDCYINFGVFQPDCTHLSANIINDIACSHYRSCDYYAESINSPLGIYCKRLPIDFVSTPDCPILGEYNNNSHGVFYTFTKTTSPYARGKDFCNKPLSVNFNTSVPSLSRLGLL